MNDQVHIERIGEQFDGLFLSKEELIRLNKEFSKLYAEARRKASIEYCYYCGKKISSHCNSHTIPRFCLKNISDSGWLCGINSILQLPEISISLGKQYTGINESGTFQLICRDCDNRLFQEYENPNAFLYNQEPSQKVLSEIVIKNYLKTIYKRMIEKSLCELVLENKSIDQISRLRISEQLKTSIIDLSSYKTSFMRAKRHLEHSYEFGYYCIYYKVLDYIVPIAVQYPITVPIGFDGDIINDVFNKNPNYIPEDLHLCIFPMSGKSVIILFIKNGDTCYRKFYKIFRKLNAEGQLGVINYLVFLYTEDFYISRSIRNKVDLSAFREVAALSQMVYSNKKVSDTFVFTEEYNLSNWRDIPNLLSEEYKL